MELFLGSVSTDAELNVMLIFELLISVDRLGPQYLEPAREL